MTNAGASPEAFADGVWSRATSIRGPAGPLAARLYRSTSRPAGDAGTLFVFFHPGGFVSGSIDASDACLRAMAARIDAVVLATTYAQAPQNPFPAAAEDAYAALADAAAHPRRYRWTGRTLVVGGAEAGGNLAAVATMMARDRGGPPVAGQVLIMPMLDPGLSSGSMRCAGDDAAGERIATRCADGYRDYLPRAADRVHPYACPLASTRLKGLPPTLMVSFDGDPLRDEAGAYVAKLAGAGVRVEIDHAAPSRVVARAGRSGRSHSARRSAMRTTRRSTASSRRSPCAEPTDTPPLLLLEETS